MFANCFTTLYWKALEKFKHFHNSLFQMPIIQRFLIHSWQFSLPNERQIWHRRNKQQAQQRRKPFSVPTTRRIATRFSATLNQPSCPSPGSTAHRFILHAWKGTPSWCPWHPRGGRGLGSSPNLMLWGELTDSTPEALLWGGASAALLQFHL